jgi:hypothetical protein
MTAWYAAFGRLAAMTVVATMISAAPPALAAERTEAVTFKSGATSATIQGSIKGDNFINYTLKANAGQVMSILFSPSNPRCYFNLLPPGSDEAIHNGSTVGHEFAGTLGVNGEYRAQVYLMRNAARRNETCNYFEISAASGDAGAVVGGVSDEAMRESCASQAASMYGIKSDHVTLANSGCVHPASGGFSIAGQVDKGSEGKKQFNCIFNKDRSLNNVMALNSDGE